MKELIPFENDLLQMVKTVEFRRTGNEFQTKLKNDMRNMGASGKTLTPADKTTNMYRLSKDQYSQLKANVVTSEYKKASEKLRKELKKAM